MNFRSPRTVSVARRAALTLLVVAALPAALAAQGVAERPEDIVYPPLPEVEIPQPTRTVLDNGLVVLVIEDHELPLVEVRATVRTGSRFEPADLIGLATLTGDQMRSGGIEGMPSDELDDFLEDHGVVLETWIGEAQGGAMLSSLREDFPEMLRLFSDVLRKPAFEEDKLAVAKGQLETSIARQNDSPGQIVGREFPELIFGEDSPYARSATYATVDAIGRDDLVAWHERWFQPQNVILGIVGDIDSARAIALAREVFGDWPRGDDPVPPVPEATMTGEPAVYFIERPDVTQSEIRIGHLGVTKEAPDFYAIEVMNEVLGGGFAARLFSSIRSEQGLAYSVRGRVGSGWDVPGTFMLSMGTKTETTAQGVDALLAEARGMIERPPTAEEVERAKQAILNSFVFNYDSASEILGQQMTFEYYGMPLDWLDRYREGIEAVTVEEVREAARRHLRLDEAVVLVLGKSEGFDRPLTTLGEVRAVDITIPPRPEPVEEVVETAETAARGAELVAGAVDAMGGAERLDAVERFRSEMSAELILPQGTLGAKGTQVVVFPDRMRQELRLPMGTMTQVLTAESGAMITPQGTMTLPPERRADLEKSFVQDPLVLLRLRDEPTWTAHALGRDTVAGHEVERVRVTLRGHPMTLGIDPESGRVVTLSYHGTNMMQVPGEVVQVFSDFRDAGGLTLPHYSEQLFDGEPMSKVTIESIDLGPEVDDTLFAVE